MLGEIGHFALVVALVLTIMQAYIPWCNYDSKQRWLHTVELARLQFMCVLLAYICLTIAFAQFDFSLRYVAQHSNTALPFLYRISGVWGAHEGSILLWILVLSGWTAATTLTPPQGHIQLYPRTLSVLGMVNLGFLLFVLATSNPFDRLFPAPLEGRELNPLLQDPGLAIHPPLLYLGYVGLAIPFAAAVASLLSTQCDRTWISWLRPWVLASWAFLTLGIALGSWWAYYELGWGGWWFWDPVENASLMPWLVGTALLHSLTASEQRKVFLGWTLLLSILAFCFSLLGTFLVRSGVVVSVHAFANDPSRGIFILIFLAVSILGALVLYAMKAPLLHSRTGFGRLSRESGLLLNNIFLLIITGVVLWGTLFPLAYDALGLGQISVGPPYFNTVIIPLFIPLAIALGIFALTRWRQDVPSRIFNLFKIPVLFSIGIAGLATLLLQQSFNWKVFLGLTIAVWITVSSLLVFKKLTSSQTRWNNRIAGMMFAHLGMALLVAGVTLTSQYSLSDDVVLGVGDSHKMGPYQFEFSHIEQLQIENYAAQRGTIKVFNANQLVATVFPEKRRYQSTRNVFTEAGIDAGFFGDIYVSLGEQSSEGLWSMRLQYKVAIRWVWAGALLMALGAFFALMNKRETTMRQATSLMAEA